MRIGGLRATWWYLLQVVLHNPELDERMAASSTAAIGIMHERLQKIQSSRLLAYALTSVTVYRNITGNHVE